MAKLITFILLLAAEKWDFQKGGQTNSFQKGKKVDKQITLLYIYVYIWFLYVYIWFLLSIFLSCFPCIYLSLFLPFFFAWYIQKTSKARKNLKGSSPNQYPFFVFPSLASPKQPLLPSAVYCLIVLFETTPMFWPSPLSTFLACVASGCNTSMKSFVQSAAAETTDSSVLSYAGWRNCRENSSQECSCVIGYTILSQPPRNKHHSHVPERAPLPNDFLSSVFPAHQAVNQRWGEITHALAVSGELYGSTEVYVVCPEEMGTYRREKLVFTKKRKLGNWKQHNKRAGTSFR